jgi:O-antigen/teichoic acid export membrane protein
MVAIVSISILFNATGTAIGVLRLLNRFRIFTAQKILESLLGLVGAITVFVMGWGIWGFVWIALTAPVVGRLFLLVSAFRALKQDGYLKYWKEGRVSEWKPFVNFSWWVYLSSTVAIPVRQVDVIIVSGALSLQAAGIYQIIKQIVQVLNMLVEPIHQAIYPQFSSLVAGKKFVDAYKYAVKVGVMIFAAIAPLGLLIAATSPFWLGRVFGEEFIAGWASLCLFLVLVVIVFPTNPVHSLFMAAGYIRETTWIMMFTSSLYLLLAWYLTPILGVQGVIWSWFVQASLLAGVKLLYMERDRKTSYR